LAKQILWLVDHMPRSEQSGVGEIHLLMSEIFVVFSHRVEVFLVVVYVSA